MFLLTDTDYLSDKVSEKLFWQKFQNDCIIPIIWQSFNLSRKYISCIYVTQFQSLLRLHAGKYSDKSSRPLECTHVHMFHNNLIINSDKFHEHLKVYKFHKICSDKKL